MNRINIKVCGMRDPANVHSVSELKPDYMGFILYSKSPRFVELQNLPGLLAIVPPGIKKAGVLVNEPIENALKLARSGFFDLLQLHGNETPAYCRILSGYTSLIKSFRISGSLPDNMEEFIPYCDLFLFDTEGTSYGGIGRKFNHDILRDYNLDTKYILSGGISAADAVTITGLSPVPAAVDLNSRFEISPGIKDTGLLKEFIDKIRSK